MYEARIIAPIRFSEWVYNLVPTRKKTGEIRLCVDLRNVNKVSLKDNYHLPKMDHILQRVVGDSRISLLDGFSGYNQILVHPDDQEKTAFTTPWGTLDPNPVNPIIEDVSDNQPNNIQPSTSVPSKGNAEEPPKVDLEATSSHNPTPAKERNTENTSEKENPTVRNTRTQTEKPFNLESEVGKLKIVVPLFELTKHDVYRS